MPLQISLTDPTDHSLVAFEMHTPDEAAATVAMDDHPDKRVLVFAHRNSTAKHALATLRTARVRVWRVTTDQDAFERDETVAAFSNGDIDALVITDDALRGVDLVGIPTSVLHVELPPYKDDVQFAAAINQRSATLGDLEEFFDAYQAQGVLAGAGA